MWFNLLKLDLSDLKQNLKPLDAEGKNIKIDDSDKCRKKLINFQNKMLAMGRREKNITKMEHEQLAPKIPEFIACKFVETIDEFFNNTVFGQMEENYANIEDMDEQYSYNNWYLSSLNWPIKLNEKPTMNIGISLQDNWANPGLDKYYISFAVKDAKLLGEVRKLWEES